MRLAAVLLGHPLGATPTTYALSALMCLNAARLSARVDAAGNLNSLFDQDRSFWDRKLVLEGPQTLQHNQLMTERRVLRLKSAFRLERRDGQSQEEEEERDHRR
jgi:predicted RNA polymerase sigma factor